MPKDSCLDHQKRGDFIVLRRHMVEMFGGDHCAAVVTAYFEYATNGEMDRLSRSEQNGEPWVTATMASIYEETTRLFSIRTLQARIDWLESIGFLTVENKGVGHIHRYLLNVDWVNACIAKQRVFTYSPSAAPSAVLPMENGSPSAAPSATASAVLPMEGGCIKSLGVEEERIEKKTSPTPPPQHNSELLPDSLVNTLCSTELTEALDRLDLEDDVLTFVTNAYRRENRRAKLDNLRARAAEPLCEKVRRAESEHGPEVFRTALLTYLACRDDEYVAGARWPIRLFLSQVEKYLPEISQNGHRCAPRGAGEAAGPSRGVDHQPAPVEGSEGPKIANPPPPLPHAAQEWNRVVTAGPPVEQWTRRDAGLAVNDPEFVAALPRVLALCQQAFQAQPPEEIGWLNFRYLLRKGKGTDVENWYRMAAGEFNWLRARRNGDVGSQRRESAVEMSRRVIEEHRRQMAANKAAAQQQQEATT